MSTIESEPIQRAPTEPRGRRAPAPRRGILLAAVITLVAGAAGGYFLRWGTEPTKETPSVSGTARESKVAVAGTEVRVRVESGPAVTQVGDIRQQRDEVWVWEDTSSDPRVSGTRRTTINLDKRRDGIADMWGSSVLTNAGGTWEGDWIGSIRTDGTHMLHSVSLGTGDYEGLRYVFFAIFAEPTGEFTSNTTLVTSGWIEAVD